MTAEYQNFTIIGSPTIKDDGIASGFSDTNYITCNNTTITTDNLTIYTKFNTGNLSTTQFSALLNTGINIGGTNNGILFEAANNYNGGGKPRIVSATGIDSTDSTSTFLLNNALQSNTDYSLKIEYSNSSISAYVYDTTGNIVSSGTSSQSVPATMKFQPCVFGRETSAGRTFPGSIDLNALKVYVNSNLVYQPYSSDFKLINRIYNRHDTASNFSTNNPTLGDGEVGLDTTSHKIKVGDGTSSWSQLPYVGDYTDGDGINITSNTITNTLATDGVARILPITQADYDDLQAVDTDTLYIIIPESN